MISPDFEILTRAAELARLVRTKADQTARRRGLSLAQWKILKLVETRPGLSQSELATEIEVEPITIVRLIDRLEAGGFVERRADPKDRRIRRLHLLPAALPVIDELVATCNELAALATAGLDKAELEAAVATIRHMKSRLAESAKLKAVSE